MIHATRQGVQDEQLFVGTSRADMDYHACWVDVKAEKEAMGGKPWRHRTALCGAGNINPTPREWDDERQARQDSCRACVRKVKAMRDAEDRARMARPPAVAAYVRASTDKQYDSPDTQIGIIRAYCRRLGLGEPATYQDKATSGGQLVVEREGGGKLMKAVRRGDHVVVAKLDRLSRHFVDFARTLDSLNKMGVTLHICDFPMGPIVPGDGLSRAFVYFLGIFAEYERTLIGQRVRENKAYLKSIGRRAGGAAPYGYRWARKPDGKDYLEIEPDEAAICLKCVELSAAGYTTVAITDYLNNVWKIRNPRAGKYSNGRPMVRRQDTLKDHPEGSFWQPKIHKLIRAGLRIIKERTRSPETSEEEADKP